MDNPPRQAGTSLVEVMVTLAILSFSLLGIAALQSKIGTAEMESYQRAQALVALSQMTERLSANTTNAALYVTAAPLGTGDAEPADCVGAGLTGAPLDLCEWSNTLKGSAETSGGGASVGGMISGRGCISGVAPNPALGVCTAGVYTVAVVWQGMSQTVVPASAAAAAAIPALGCGAGLYGANDALRRLVSATVTIPTTSCF